MDEGKVLPSHFSLDILSSTFPHTPYALTFILGHHHYKYIPSPRINIIVDDEVFKTPSSAMVVRTLVFLQKCA